MAIDSEGGTADGPALVPVRMLNEFAYCPRLFYLEFVQGEFADNEFTVEGRVGHRRVDKPSAQREPVEDAPFQIRSLSLSSMRLGLSAKIDVVEGDETGLTPVDFKRGEPPKNELRSYEPERVQLCAYGLLLREHGFTCERGFLYFIGSKERVEVRFDDALVERTLALLSELTEAAASARIPPPLVNSPKCDGCSLVGICLPDEVNHVVTVGETVEDEAQVRRLIPARDDASPLYVQTHGVRVGIAGERIEVRARGGELMAAAKLFELSQLVIQGNAQVTTQAIRELCSREIPICWMSAGGWLYGISEGLGSKNIELRVAQHRMAQDLELCLSLAKRVVRAKVANSRTILRRNLEEAPESLLRDLASTGRSADDATSLGELLGIEGNAARLYFGALPGAIRPRSAEPAEFSFDFTTRSRRPPRDPVNALLSYAYSLLAKDMTLAVRSAGFEPFLGFYHQPRYGRPALALDLMEEFRPIVADSVVLTAINTGVVDGDDFIRAAGGVALKPTARKRFLAAYERRMNELVTHPVFGYRISYRRVLEVQVRLLGRHLLGEIPSFPEFRTR